ncbi:MAG: hypothetical protein M0P61_09845 [Ignavibacteriaceae bacterium]|jgi:N-dimethylarginine dimethylaminohydrolase|nr:hypothetical protein [Ignavibacteriaceae bacterium]
MENNQRIIGVYNEWGKLREAVVGIADDTVEIDFIPAMKWLPPEGIDACLKYGGKKTADVFPEYFEILKQQLEGHVKVLEEHGVIVHRTKPILYKEENDFLTTIQKGNMLFGGADFFRVIGSNVLLLNSFRYPFRRKQVWVVRPLLEELIKNTNTRYCATPPPSPHYTEEDIYLENGDIMIDGFNVYCGMSGNASNEKGIDWLQQFLGSDYRIHIIPLASTRFHLDWVLTLNRPGLLTYCKDAIIGDLPESLQPWDKIVVNADEAAGANNLSIDPNTIVVAEQYGRIADEYLKRGMNVITIPLDMTIAYGSGSRCLTAVLRRDA